MMANAATTSVPYGHVYQKYLGELMRRLEKLSKNYDLSTMKIFMTVEGLGDSNVYYIFNPAATRGGRVTYLYPNTLPPLLLPPSLDLRAQPLGGHSPQLMRRLEKLSRCYDFGTMKMYIVSNALGTKAIYDVYDPAVEKKALWGRFLHRKEACRLDLTNHVTTREKYQQFLAEVGREDQGRHFFHSMIALLQSKGAVDIFKHISPKYQNELESTFCGHLCKLFDKKFETWFDSFEAVNVSLIAHVKVSNLVRVLNGQVDVLCRKQGVLYAVNIKVTGMLTPRPMDINELCLVKSMLLQNGLASPDSVICAMLICHLEEERPVLRLWEYRPTAEMDAAIREADIDRMIESGKMSQFHEMWAQNLCPPGVGNITARADRGNGAAELPSKSARNPVVNGVSYAVNNSNKRKTPTLA